MIKILEYLRQLIKSTSPISEPTFRANCDYHELYISPNREQRLYFIVNGPNKYSIEVGVNYHLDGTGVHDQPCLTKNQVLSITDKIRDIVNAEASPEDGRPGEER